MRHQILLLLLVLSGTCFSQTVKLEAVKGHYKTLQQFSPQENASRAWMDTLSFPPAEYGNSVVYLLVKPFYLTDDEVKSISETVTFPANSSDQTRNELDYLLGLQKNRTPEEVKRVEFLGNIGYWPSVNLLPSHPGYAQNLKDLFFEGREIINADINAMNFPKVAKVLKGVMQDMRIMEFTIKYKQLRARPYHLEPSIQAMAKMGSPSFASGHTLWAFIQAFTWSEIVPERQKDFIALAEEIRRSREIMGIHYPSDNEASRQVAYKMFQAYFKNPTFRKDLTDAIQEWKTTAQKYMK